MATVPVWARGRGFPSPPGARYPRPSCNWWPPKAPQGPGAWMWGAMSPPSPCSLLYLPSALQQWRRSRSGRTQGQAGTLPYCKSLQSSLYLQNNLKKKKRQFPWEDAYKLWFQKIGGKMAEYTHMHTPHAQGNVMKLEAHVEKVWKSTGHPWSLLLLEALLMPIVRAAGRFGRWYAHLWGLHSHQGPYWC